MSLTAPEPLIRCAGGCGRTRPAEDMVLVGELLICEPCQAGIARAEARNDSLDAAWAAAENIKGWVVASLLLDGGSEDHDYELDRWEASAVDAPDAELSVFAYGPTPAQALRALAAKLIEARS